MTVQELLEHPSIQRELSRFQVIGGNVSVVGNEVTLSAMNIVPDSIIQAFAKRIKKLDKDNVLRVNIK